MSGCLATGLKVQRAHPLRIRYESITPGRSKPELSQDEPAYTCSPSGGGQGDNNPGDTDGNAVAAGSWGGAAS